MRLTEGLVFGFSSHLGEPEALEFVRDVKRSLAAAHLLDRLRVDGGPPALVSANLPVNTPLFGRRELPFASELHFTPQGARLVPTSTEPEGRGWAEVGGEARVAPEGNGSRIDYALDLTIYLDLPEADRWGTRALTKMIELTAGSVLRQLSERLRGAVEEAARAYPRAV